jgi:prevent-host-death family protein
MSVLRLAEVRNRLPELVAEVERTRARVTVTKGGRPAAVLIAPADLWSLEETAVVLADVELTTALAAARQQVAAGQVTDAAGLAVAMTAALVAGAGGPAAGPAGGRSGSVADG